MRDAGAVDPDVGAFRVREIVRRLRGPGVGAQVARGGAASFLAASVAAVFAVAVQVLFSRLLGAAAFGDYIYSLSWVNFLAMVGVLGFETAAVRFVAAYRAQGNWGHLRGFVRYSAGLTAVLSATLGLVIVGVVLSVHMKTPTLAWTLCVAAALLPVLSLLKVLCAVLQGTRSAVLAQMLQGIVRPLLLALGFAAVYMTSRRFATAPVAMTINVCATVVVLGVVWRSLRRRLGGEFSAAIPAHDRGLWIQESIPLFLITVSQTLMTSTDTLMLGTMVGTTQAGIYQVASQLASVVTFAISAVNVVLAPMISELHVQQRRHELQRMLTLSARGVFLFGFPAALVIVGGGTLLLRMYGPDFVAGFPAMAILVAGQFMIVFCGSVGLVMTMTNHGKHASAVVIITALVNLVLCFVLIPRFGMAGAATATAVTWAARSVVLSLFVRRRLGYSATIVGRGTTPVSNA